MPATMPAGIKFYIQIWVFWSALAAVAVGWLAPQLARTRWGHWWRAAFVALVVCGLVYPITAARAKIGDRFEAMGDIPPDMREAYRANWRLLDGV